MAKSSSLRAHRIIAVGGPPHSGKSVFLNALHNAMISRVGDQAFLQRCCPDGEGKWSAEADPEVVRQIRQKGSFSPTFVEYSLEVIEQLRQSKSLVLLDLGGKLTNENRQFLAACTHFIVLSSSPDQLPVWRDFGQQAGAQCLALLQSTLQTLPDGTIDLAARSKLSLETDPIEGQLFNLDRDSPEDCYGDCIQSLADFVCWD